MKHSKSGIFLMELIISILFFALASAVCIQLFAKAHILGQETTEQNKSIMWAQNLAELYLGCDGNIDEIAAYLLADNTLSEENIEIFRRQESTGTLGIYFDRDFSPCSPADTVMYVAELDTGISEDVLYGHVTVIKTPSGKFDYTASILQSNFSMYNPVLYSLDIRHHRAATLEEMEELYHE